MGVDSSRQPRSRAQGMTSPEHALLVHYDREIAQEPKQTPQRAEGQVPLLIILTHTTEDKTSTTSTTSNNRRTAGAATIRRSDRTSDLRRFNNSTNPWTWMQSRIRSKSSYVTFSATHDIHIRCGGFMGVISLAGKIPSYADGLVRWISYANQGRRRWVDRVEDDR